MKCANCGTEYKEGKKFCYNCGERVDINAPAAEAKPAPAVQPAPAPIAQPVAEIKPAPAPIAQPAVNAAPAAQPAPVYQPVPQVMPVFVAGAPAYPVPPNAGQVSAPQYQNQQYQNQPYQNQQYRNPNQPQYYHNAGQPMPPQQNQGQYYNQYQGQYQNNGYRPVPPAYMPPPQSQPLPAPKSDKADGGLLALCWLLPVIAFMLTGGTMAFLGCIMGLVLFCTNRKAYPNAAKAYGTAALVWAIICAVGYIGVGGAMWFLWW